MEGKYKQKIISGEFGDKKEGTTLRKVKLALKRMILDYEEKRREYEEDFDVYDFICETLGEGFAEPTVRKFLNINNSSFFEPEKFLALCDLCNDYRPVQVLKKYFDHRERIRERA